MLEGISGDVDIVIRSSIFLIDAYEGFLPFHRDGGRGMVSFLMIIYFIEIALISWRKMFLCCSRFLSQRGKEKIINCKLSK